MEIVVKILKDEENSEKNCTQPILKLKKESDHYPILTVEQ
jgi:hypothetical protein